MRADTRVNERRAKVSAICLALPEATSTDLGDHADFRVGKKVFAYFLDDHHGDGIVGMWCKVLPGENERLIAASPRKFYMPAYVGPRGWVGLRLDRQTMDWAEVKELATASYVQVAPKRLARRVEEAELQ
jgi:predicted DNA-binding protein (MmcQ/YjbR family)